MSPRAGRAPAARLAALGIATALLGGCVTFAPRSQTPGPEAVVLERVPVRVFEDDRCGSGSLSVVLNALGDPVSEGELAAALPEAPGGGTLSLDLLLAARERGFSASLGEGSDEALQREIHEGRPVILMLRLLNAPGRQRDIFHYVVVDGHDPARSLFRLQFGDGKARWSRLSSIEGAWKGAGRAMLRVSAPAAFEEMKEALALEAAGRLDEAADRYGRILAAHPDSQRAWVNLGNVEAARGRTADAERAYRLALTLAPEEQDASNNLAWLLLQEGSRLEEAEALARAAAQKRGPEQALVLDTLARIQAARGRCADADATFVEALTLASLPAAWRGRLDEARRDTAVRCLPPPEALTPR